MAERPKRRKYKDNPYTLNYCEEKNIYTITFKDSRGVKHEVEVSRKIYKAFDNFELEDLSEMNEYDRHIEHSEIFENNLNILPYCTVCYIDKFTIAITISLSF